MPAPMGDVRYAVRRLTISVPSLRDFRRRYGQAVSDVPLDQIRGLIEQEASWAEMLSLIESAAPNEFLIYYRNDVDPVMELAGDREGCSAYLMGNHTIAERMFRHDPRAMLYAPLHTVVWEDRAGQAWFSFDQPSTQFASFGIPEIDAVGRELDHKLAQLLRVLDAEVPEPLRAVDSLA
jgi:hypothetical protein